MSREFVARNGIYTPSNITGSTFYGSGAGLTNIPISGITNYDSRLGRYNQVTVSAPTSGSTLTVTGGTKILFNGRLTSSNVFTINTPSDDPSYLNESILVFSIGASLPSITQPNFPTPGTVTATSGSTTITGSGTLFLSYFKSGDSFRFPDGSIYIVNTVSSNTSMTMTVAYTGATSSGLVLNRYAMWRSGTKPTLSINTSWTFSYEWNTINSVTEIYVGFSQNY